MNIFLGELLGTAALILFGNGVVAGALLKASKAENAGWMAITAGWAFAVFVGIVVAKACGSAAAYLNPAFAIGMAVRHGDWTGIPQAIAGELLGAMLGAALVFLHYLPTGGAPPTRRSSARPSAPRRRCATSGRTWSARSSAPSR